jgi:hypothetical protein
LALLAGVSSAVAAAAVSLSSSARRTRFFDADSVGGDLEMAKGTPKANKTAAPAKPASASKGTPKSKASSALLASASSDLDSVF